MRGRGTEEKGRWGRGTAESRGGGEAVGLRRVEGEVRPWDCGESRGR